MNDKRDDIVAEAPNAPSAEVPAETPRYDHVEKGSDEAADRAPSRD